MTPSHHQLAKNWNLISGWGSFSPASSSPLPWPFDKLKQWAADVNRCSKSPQASLLEEYTYSYTVHTQLVPWCCKSNDWNQQAFIVWMFTNSIIWHLICTEAEAQLRFHNNWDTPVGGPRAAWSVCSCVLYCAQEDYRRLLITGYWKMDIVWLRAIFIISTIGIKRQMRLQTLAPFVSIVQLKDFIYFLQVFINYITSCLPNPSFRLGWSCRRQFRALHCSSKMLTKTLDR